MGAGQTSLDARGCRGGIQKLQRSEVEGPTEHGCAEPVVASQAGGKQEPNKSTAGPQNCRSEDGFN